LVSFQPLDKISDSDTYLCDLAIGLGDILLFDELGFVTFADSTRLSLITNLWGDSAHLFHLVMKIPAWSNGYILGVRVQIWLY